MRKPRNKNLIGLKVGESRWATPTFTVYRQVLSGWDKDHDERIYTLIDSLEEAFPGQLAFAAQHEGDVVLARHGPPPPNLATGEFCEG